MAEIEGEYGDNFIVIKIADALLKHYLYENNKKPELTLGEIESYHKLSIPINRYNQDYERDIYSPHQIIEKFYDQVSEAERSFDDISLFDEIDGYKFIKNYPELIRPLDIEEHVYCSELSFLLLFSMKGYTKLNYCTSENLKDKAIQIHSEGMQVLSIMPQIIPSIMPCKDFFEAKFKNLIYPMNNLNEDTTHSLMNMFNLYLRAAEK